MDTDDPFPVPESVNRQDVDVATYVRSLPKAELHVHLEGTLEPETALLCARRNGVRLRWDSAEQLREAYDFDGLPDFLDVLFQVAATMRCRQDFYDLTLSYLSRAVHDGVRRAEMFFGPQTFLDAGVPIADMVEGILAAIRDAGRQWGIDAALVPTAQRHRTQADALELLDLLEPWRDALIGIGLGSAERGNPPAKFAEYFALARRRGYRLAVHAGEDAPVEYVAEALDVCRPDRIDHGIAIVDDPGLAVRIRDEGIPLTMCPLSNTALRVVPDLREHPLARLLRDGLNVTINSDDPPFFGGYIADNYVAAAAALEMTSTEIGRLAANSINASWTEEDHRRRLLTELQHRLGLENG